MKKILVPTDFSDNAYNALEYAIQLGQSFEANVAVYHTYHVMSTAGTFRTVRNYIEDDNQEALTTIKEKVAANFGKEISIQTAAIEGEMTNVINNIVEKEAFDLIVMGTKGASGLKEIFLGSNTASLMQKSSIPVLAIPTNYQYKPIKKIVFAVDNKDIDEEKTVRILKDIAKNQDAQLLVFHLAKEDAEKGIDPALSYHLEALENISIIYEFGGKVMQRIHEFVENNQADMLCMIHHKKGFIRRLLEGDKTIQEVHHPSVPLLILKE